ATEAVIRPLLRAAALSTADFPVQPVTGKLADHLMIEFYRADMARAVAQPAQRVAIRQRQGAHVAQCIPRVADITFTAVFA
ncbi:hypothetical protein KU73_23425, partial [Pectobacterium wasabiae]